MWYKVGLSLPDWKRSCSVCGDQLLSDGNWQDSKVAHSQAGTPSWNTCCQPDCEATLLLASSVHKPASARLTSDKLSADSKLMRHQTVQTCGPHPQENMFLGHRWNDRFCSSISSCDVLVFFVSDCDGFLFFLFQIVTGFLFFNFRLWRVFVFSISDCDGFFHWFDCDRFFSLLRLWRFFFHYFDCDGFFVFTDSIVTVFFSITSIVTGIFAPPVTIWWFWNFQWRVF